MCQLETISRQVAKPAKFLTIEVFLANFAALREIHSLMVNVNQAELNWRSLPITCWSR
jgi:hypothetical protein